MSIDPDICPICKSSRYLNPDMKFKVSTECYHKMCESCVDRIFSLGPAPCPYAACHKTLRKNKFTDQKFEDIGVEKEVNIRGRVQRIYNRGEEHFSSLDAYNDYLEQIEDIVFNLVNNIDMEETERRMQEYERSNKEEIRAIDLHRVEESRKQAALVKIEQERKQKEMEYQIARNRADKELEEQQRQDTLRQLATSDATAEEIMEQTRKRHKEQRKQRMRELRETQAKKMGPPQGTGSAVVANRAIGSNGTPFTPFDGDRQQQYLFEVQDDYYDPLMQGLANDMHYKASGFKLHDAYQQALVQAFFGLGCDIQKEKSITQPQQPVSTS